MELALFLAGSFLIGSIPFGYLIAKAKGVDIRGTGSGNIGATNVWRTLGAGPGLLAFILDVAKGAVPAYFGGEILGAGPYAVLCGIAAVMGHVFSPWLGFKGGKGIATGLGLLIGSDPVIATLSLVCFLLGMIFTRIVSLSSLIATALMMTLSISLARDPVVIVVMWLMGIVIFKKHWPNIQRLRQGTEPQFEFKRKQEKAP